MTDERLAGAATLTVVRALCVGERAAEQVAIDVGLVSLDVGDQLLYEVLMPLLSLDNRHVPSVDGGPNEGSCRTGEFPKGMAGELAKGRLLFRRIRMRARARAIRRLTRMIVELDSLAASRG